MNDSDSGSAIDGNADHACDVVQMAFGEAFCAVERVDPDDHVFFEEFVWELVEVEVGLRGLLTVNVFQISQITPVPMLMHIIVVQKHFLTDVMLIQLVRHDIRLH